MIIGNSEITELHWGEGKPIKDIKDIVKNAISMFAIKEPENPNVYSERLVKSLNKNMRLRDELLCKRPDSLMTK